MVNKSKITFLVDFSVFYSVYHFFEVCGIFISAAFLSTFLTVKNNSAESGRVEYTYIILSVS